MRFGELPSSEIGREVVEHVVLQLGKQERHDGMPARNDHKGVAVRRGFRRRLRREGAAGAGPVLDDDRLPEALGELVAEGARNDVDRAAGRKRHKEMDRLRRIGVLGKRGGGPDRCRDKAPDQALHGVLPLADGVRPLLAGTVVRMLLGRKVHFAARR